MNGLAYPLRALWASYLRATIGFLLMAGWIAAAGPGIFGVVVLGGLATVFLVYGLRTALRQATRYGFDDIGIYAVGPMPRAIRWDDLAKVRLSYYTTKREGAASRMDGSASKREGSSGWWQLDLKGRSSTMRLDSTLDGFAALAERAVREARARDVELSPTTVENLRPLGIDTGEARR